MTIDFMILIASLEDTIGGVMFGDSIFLVLSFVLNSSLLLSYKEHSL